MSSGLNRVSVIIPMRNAAETIGRALESVALQSSLPDEVVVVDNASTDDSVTQANKYNATLPLKIIRNEIPGSGATRNAGIRAASGGLFAFLDADDVWYPTKLEVQRNALDHPGPRFSGTYMHYLTPTGVVLGNNVRYPSGEAACQALRNAIALPTSLSSIVIGREVVDKAGLFDPLFRRAQDFEWLVRVAQIADLKVPSQEPLVGYVLASGTSTDDSYVEQALAADEVRAARRENRKPDYANYVVGRMPLAASKRQYRAGALYRRAGVEVGRRRYLRGAVTMLRATALDPRGVWAKARWQSVAKPSGSVPESVLSLFRSEVAR